AGACGAVGEAGSGGAGGGRSAGEPSRRRGADEGKAMERTRPKPRPVHLLVSALRLGEGSRGADEVHFLDAGAEEAVEDANHVGVRHARSLGERGVDLALQVLAGLRELRDLRLDAREELV